MRRGLGLRLGVYGTPCRHRASSGGAPHPPHSRCKLHLQAGTESRPCYVGCQDQAKSSQGCPPPLLFLVLLLFTLKESRFFSLLFVLDGNTLLVRPQRYALILRSSSTATGAGSGSYRPNGFSRSSAPPLPYLHRYTNSSPRTMLAHNPIPTRRATATIAFFFPIRSRRRWKCLPADSSQRTIHHAACTNTRRR